jgi:hypothetical protein
MFPKAYRWVAEMEEIAAFLGSEQNGAEIYAGTARLYEQITEDLKSGGDDRSIVAAVQSFARRR